MLHVLRHSALVVGCLLAIAAHTLARLHYGYDKAGNRTYSRVTQKPSGAPLYYDGDNDRSCEYGYDGLHRLKSAKMGALDANNHVMDAAPVTRDITWQLDALGNWSGGSSNVSVIAKGDYNVNGQADDPEKALHHQVQPGNNRLDQVWTKIGLSPATSETILTDPAGNLVSDNAGQSPISAGRI